MSLTELIRREIEALRVSKISAREISRLTGFNQTTTWRYLNDLSKIPFDFIVALEQAELIKPMKQLFI